MQISIFGIGYVGAVSAACLARDGHEVVAIDIDLTKVGDLAAGRSPIVEPGLSDLIARMVAEGRLTATADAAAAVAASDVSIVCVGTPSRSNGSLETDYVERVADSIGALLATKTRRHTVVVRSTLLPGSMRDLVIPRLEASSGLRAGRDFGVGYFPEFLREGSAIADYDRPGLVVYAATDEDALAQLRAINAGLGLAPLELSIASAEMIKYTNNAWHALKISFANEIGLICKASGVDSHEVMRALCADAKLNISPAYLTPGFAFGGSCLPKDVRALRHRARTQDMETPLLDATLAANENQIDRAYRLVEDSGSRRIGLLGLSFKPETDDLRYSPFVELAQRLIGRGYEVCAYDPIIRLSQLTGANKRYVFERLPHIAQILLEDPACLIERSDLVVVGHRAVGASLMPAIRARGLKVVDLVRVDAEVRSAGAYEGLCW